jgi:hypothetical protein
MQNRFIQKRTFFFVLFFAFLAALRLLRRFLVDLRALRPLRAAFLERLLGALT